MSSLQISCINFDLQRVHNRIILDVINVINRAVTECKVDANKQLMSASVMRKNREFHRGSCRKICLSFMWIYLFFYPNPPDSSRSFYLLCNEIVKLKIFVSFIRTIIHHYVANGDLKNRSFLRKNFINFHLLNVFL